MGIAPQTHDAATGRLLRCAAVFLPATLPREGRMAFWDPEGHPLPDRDDLWAPGTGTGADTSAPAEADGSGVRTSEIIVVRHHGEQETSAGAPCPPCCSP